MEKKEYRKNAKAMIYLISCVINNRMPKKEKLEIIDISQLYEVCEEHNLTACTAYALESVGIQDHEFRQAKEKAIRKNILLDAERMKIFSRFEQNGIWYMPLKGALLKDMYPKSGMRQMSDNDILFDVEHREEVKQIMTEYGFELKASNEVVDEFIKEPIYNFEMHNELFRKKEVGDLADYYYGIKSKMLKDSGNKYGYHLSNEEFYLFMMAHEYKHFTFGGTGVRSLLDTFIFLRKYEKELDWEYITAESKKLNMYEFEKNNRELAMKLFVLKKLTDEEKKLLDYYIFSGTYGTYENKFENDVNNYGNSSKKQYFFYRVFPPLEHYKIWYPWAYEHKVLLPVAWLYRPIRGIFKRRNILLTELRYLKRIK